MLGMLRANAPVWIRLRVRKRIMIRVRGSVGGAVGSKHVSSVLDGPSSPTRAPMLYRYPFIISYFHP